MSFPRYPAYKNSEAEWLGAVPKNWEVIPLKRVANFINGAAFKPSEWAESGIPIIRIENLNGGESFNHFSGDLDPRYIVEPGDLLFGWSGNRGTSFGPYIWSKEGKYALNQHIFRVIFDGLDSQWFFWSLVAVTSHVEDQAHGIIGMVHVTKSDLGAIKIPFPNEREQRRIAVFLDRETVKIDELVAEQKKLIILLKEKRQAVISHAVTKGLDPNVLLKESEVEWMGKVPQHWEVAHLKRFCLDITDGAHISPDTEGGVYPFVSTKDLSGETIDFDGALLTSESSYDYLLKTGCRPFQGDVLFSKDGTIGRTVVVRDDREFVVASSLIIIRPDTKVLDADYLNFLCKSFLVVAQVESFVKGAGLPRLSIQNLLKVLGVFPPKGEQERIAEFLLGKQAQFDALIKEAESAIDLLKERRTALVSAVVTGQIDVRDLVTEEEEKAA
ncbi:restriction endonuclease subunit S [Pseudomonas sp. S1Bt23]|uniref:restriction endonuclease subunit S n=1 Tax=Pseudomonas sp. S1Bt23 TaxID=3095074 RepID=UPI002A59D1B3|nr:restriction endonuclease subunit S [Pseudomonas sp. S1Bt23]WPO49258.1 restriction endonuclease subunit S [Pseudomonas sp. S1Bt23]